MCVTLVLHHCCAAQELNSDTTQFPLNGLSPGQYAMCVKAHTLAGGAESSWVTVTVGKL